MRHSRDVPCHLQPGRVENEDDRPEVAVRCRRCPARFGGDEPDGNPQTPGRARGVRSGESGRSEAHRGDRREGRGTDGTGTRDETGSGTCRGDPCDRLDDGSGRPRPAWLHRNLWTTGPSWGELHRRRRRGDDERHRRAGALQCARRGRTAGPRDRLLDGRWSRRCPDLGEQEGQRSPQNDAISVQPTSTMRLAVPAAPNTTVGPRTMKPSFWANTNGWSVPSEKSICFAYVVAFTFVIV